MRVLVRHRCAVVESYCRASCNILSEVAVCAADPVATGWRLPRGWTSAAEQCPYQLCVHSVVRFSPPRLYGSAPPPPVRLAFLAFFPRLTGNPLSLAAAQVLREMRERGVRLSAQAFTLAMAACLEGHRDRPRTEIEDGGRQEGRPPAADLRLSRAALSLFDRLVAAGEAPNGSSYALALKVRRDPACTRDCLRVVLPCCLGKRLTSARTA